MREPGRQERYDGRSVSVWSCRVPALEAPRAEAIAPASTLVFPRAPAKITHHPGDELVADPTRVTIYRRDMAFSRAAFGPAGTWSDWVRVPHALVDEALQGVPHAPFLVVPCPMRALLLERLLLDELTPDADALWVEEAVALLLDAVLGSVRPRVGLPRHQRIIADVMALIAADPARLFSLSDLAAAAGVSPYHLCRVFRTETGWTITAYREELRLRLAIDGLGAAHEPEEVVALRLGYRNLQVFRRRFRALTGMSTADARQRHAESRGMMIRAAVFGIRRGRRGTAGVRAGADFCSPGRPPMSAE
jgi:AraC-like DNA-binding protein